MEGDAGAGAVAADGFSGAAGGSMSRWPERDGGNGTLTLRMTRSQLHGGQSLLSNPRSH